MKIRLLLIISSLMFISCELSPCDCYNAELYNDKETIKKCDDKLSKMTQSEQVEFNKKFVKCNTNSN